MKETLKLLTIPAFAGLGILFYEYIGVMSAIGGAGVHRHSEIIGGFMFLGAPFVIMQILAMAYIDERL